MRLGGCSDAGRMVLLALALCCAPAAGDEDLDLEGLDDELETNLTDLLANVSDTDGPVYRSGLLPKQQPFDPRGMGMLYNATPVIIDTIVVKEGFLMEGIVEVKDGHLELFTKKVTWQKFLAHYAGPIAFVACFALFGIVLPVAGVFWCCCHMCGRRRRRPFDRKHDSRLKMLLAVLLIVLLTLFLFGVVCAFTTEQQLEEGIDRAGAEVDRQARAVQAEINATTGSIHGRVTAFTGTLSKFISFGGSRQASEMTYMEAVTSLNSIVQQLDDVQRDLREVRQLTLMLRFQAEQLNTGLRKVKRNLLQTLANCDMPACINLQRKHHIGELTTDIQYSQMLDKYFPTMPDVSELLSNVTALLDARIQDDVAAGERALKGEGARPRGLFGLFDMVKQKLGEFESSVKEYGDKVNNEVRKFRELVGKYWRDVRGYARYRRYAGLGVAVALLLVTLVLAWGLLCGVCGKRPDVYGAGDCCNKGSGARCLYFGMILIFAVGAVFCAMTAGYFVSGVLLQRLLCDPLGEPRSSAVVQLADRFVGLEKRVLKDKAEEPPRLTVRRLLMRCHRNHTLYAMLDVPRLIRKFMAAAPAAAKNATQRAPPPHEKVVLLSDSAKRKLQELADSGLSDFQFDRIQSALEINLTSLELPALARTLERAADGVGARAGYGSVPAELRASAEALRALHSDIVAPMLQHTATLNATARRLGAAARYNRTALRPAIARLLADTQRAEDFLNDNGTDTRIFDVKAKVVNLIADNMSPAILGYCGPFSAAINASSAAVCRDVLLPLNGYWVSVGYCVLLLLPLLLVCGRLARLYLQVDPYPGPLVEAEYMYDAYADRDNIPLANAYKAEKRYMRGRGGACGPGPCGATVAGAGAARGAGEAAALAPRVDAHARRYNDMAPKHWEEGPPRYHGPATEYERPPPYYYPGPNDRQ